MQCSLTPIYSVDRRRRNAAPTMNAREKSINAPFVRAFNANQHKNTNNNVQPQSNIYSGLIENPSYHVHTNTYDNLYAETNTHSVPRAFGTSDSRLTSWDNPLYHAGFSSYARPQANKPTTIKSPQSDSVLSSWSQRKHKYNYSNKNNNTNNSYKYSNVMNGSRRSHFSRAAASMVR